MNYISKRNELMDLRSRYVDFLKHASLYGTKKLQKEIQSIDEKLMEIKAMDRWEFQQDVKELAVVVASNLNQNVRLDIGPAKKF